jgi:hypothetical protein
MKPLSCALFSIALSFAFLVPANTYEIIEAVYPTVPETADSPEAFVPEGWAIEVMEKGDLNKDKRDDLLLVLKETNPDNMMTNEPDSPGMHEWDANPRILAVAFALKMGGYKLVFQNNDILPRHDDPCIDDPFGGASIVDGAIQIGYHFWANAGSWYTSGTWFTFRYQHGGFLLVAYTNYTTKRNTGESWDLKLDYLSRKAEMTVGSFSSDDEEEVKTYTRKLPPDSLVPIEQVSAINGFYPEQTDLAWWGIEEAE